MKKNVKKKSAGKTVKKTAKKAVKKSVKKPVSKPAKPASGKKGKPAPVKAAPIAVKPPVKAMNKKDREFFKKIIIQKRDKLLDELSLIEEGNFHKGVREYSGDLSVYSLHMADKATDELDREQAFQFHSREGKYLNHLNEALDKIEQGAYGVCEKCGKTIAKERLEAVPIAKHCIRCKNAANAVKKPGP
jgi:DnaK suppressor protein